MLQINVKRGNTVGIFVLKLEHCLIIQMERIDFQLIIQVSEDYLIKD